MGLPTHALSAITQDWSCCGAIRLEQSVQLEALHIVQQVPEGLLHLSRLDDFMIQAGQSSGRHLMFSGQTQEHHTWCFVLIVTIEAIYAAQQVFATLLHLSCLHHLMIQAGNRVIAITLPRNLSDPF